MSIKQENNEKVSHDGSHHVRHSAFWWLFRKPIKLIKYYNYLHNIAISNKGNDYDFPELNWYMRN